MDRVALEAKLRPERLTKGELNKLRNEEKVPAVVYGRGKETMSVILDARSLWKVLTTESGNNVIIELDVQNGAKGKQKKETVMLKDIDRDIMLREKIIHADFIRISLSEKLTVNVPLNFTGDPVGIKEGGILQTLKREVEINCLPTAIPESLDIDISTLKIGDSLLAMNLELPEGVELLAEPEEMLVQIVAPGQEEEETVDAEEGADKEDTAGETEETAVEE